MKYLAKIIGYMIPAMLAMSVWDILVQDWGVLGGVMAAVLIIFPTWAVNHYLDLTGNLDSQAFVDQGLAIFIGGQARDAYLHGSIAVNIEALPTILVVFAGAAAAGIVAGLIEKDKKVER